MVLSSTTSKVNKEIAEETKVVLKLAILDCGGVEIPQKNYQKKKKMSHG